MSRIETFAGDGAARGTAAYRIAYLANDLTDATVQKCTGPSTPCSTPRSWEAVSGSSRGLT